MQNIIELIEAFDDMFGLLIKSVAVSTKNTSDWGFDYRFLLKNSMGGEINDERSP